MGGDGGIRAGETTGATEALDSQKRLQPGPALQLLGIALAVHRNR